VSLRAIGSLILVVLALAGGAGLYCAGKSEGGRSMKIQQLEAKRDTAAQVTAEAIKAREFIEPKAREAVKRSDERREKRRARQLAVVDSNTIKLNGEFLTAQPRVIAIIAEDKQIMAGDSITIDLLQALQRRTEAERDAWKAEALLGREEIDELKKGRRAATLRTVGTTVVLTVVTIGGILAAVVF
jgi:hypothetical protein